MGKVPYRLVGIVFRVVGSSLVVLEDWGGIGMREAGLEIWSQVDIHEVCWHGSQCEY